MELAEEYNVEGLVQELSAAEKLVRDRFVEEYLKDYDQLGAAIRLGYSEAFASQYATKFMAEPYVRNAITDREEELGLSTEEAQHRRRIVAGLYREANSRFNSGSARVAALGQLAKIVGIEAPVKSEVNLKTDAPKLEHLSIEDLEEIKNKLYVTSTH